MKHKEALYSIRSLGDKLSLRMNQNNKLKYWQLYELIGMCRAVKRVVVTLITKLWQRQTSPGCRGHAEQALSMLICALSPSPCQKLMLNLNSCPYHSIAMAHCSAPVLQRLVGRGVENTVSSSWVLRRPCQSQSSGDNSKTHKKSRVYSHLCLIMMMMT